jgi:hypothetical protein
MEIPADPALLPTPPAEEASEIQARAAPSLATRETPELQMRAMRSLMAAWQAVGPGEARGRTQAVPQPAGHQAPTDDRRADLPTL